MAFGLVDTLRIPRHEHTFAAFIDIKKAWVDFGIVQGRILSPLVFNLLVDSLAATLRFALVASEPFRHVCQLYADDLVISTASQALQVALDTVHAWGVRWRFSFGIGPTKSATVVFGPCTVALTAAFPCTWSAVQVFGRCPFSHFSWRPHVDFICSWGSLSLSPGQCLVPC